MNTTLEDEVPINLNPNVGVHWARIAPGKMPENSHDESYLLSMYQDVDRAVASFTGISLKARVVACTSLSFANETRRSFDSLCRKRGWMTVQDAICENWHQLNAGLTVLIGPYSNALLASAVESLRNRGIEISGYEGIPYSNEIKDITVENVADFIIALKLPNPSTVIISCTALYLIGLCSILTERGRGDIIIISSNGAIRDQINRIASKNSQLGQPKMV